MAMMRPTDRILDKVEEYKIQLSLDCEMSRLEKDDLCQCKKYHLRNFVVRIFMSSSQSQTIRKDE